jgi:hypothetical protein
MAAPAEHFSAMAQRIGKIDPSEFAGAVVIVPPGDGPVIAFLEQDPSPLAAQFWTNVRNRVEIAGTQAQMSEAQQQPWGARR